MKPERFLDRAQAQAAQLLNRPELVARIAARAGDKAVRFRSQLDQGFDDLQTMTRLIKSWAVGKYRVVPVRSLVAFLGALLYFLIPVDAVPDFIVGLGLLDDLAIIAKVVQTFRADLLQFRQWESGDTKIDTDTDQPQGE